MKYPGQLTEPCWRAW